MHSDSSQQDLGDLAPINEPIVSDVSDGLFDRRWRPVVVALFLFLILLIFRTAWLSEDSYIGWRVVDNFVHGHGLRWNLLDRVQVFTDPLFILVVSGFYFITHEIFITVTLLCIVFSAIAAYLVVRKISVSTTAGLVALAAFLSSRAFMDYSTSGLENPMTFLLMACFYLVYFRTELWDLRRSCLLIFLLALVGLNRLDAMLLLIPGVLLVVLGFILSERPPFWRLIGWFALASSPLWLWLLFSVVYYGFPFPNTYYAKLHTGIPASALFFQGCLYYFNTLNRDPITLVVIGCAIWLAFAGGRIRAIAAACGIFLYLIYIIKIGGDFMAGRFFTIPFFAAVALIVRADLRPRAFVMLAICTIGLGLLVQRPSLFNDEDYFIGAPMREVVDHRGIADERGFIFQQSGLLPVLQRLRLEPAPTWARRALAVRATGSTFAIFGNIGFYGFYVGPQQYILDPYGLADPLLSKLPVSPLELTYWRIGHFERTVPAGYPETIQSGKNQIEDPRIAKLYDVIKIITQDPIWSWRRFKAIYRINTGHYNKLMRQPQSEAPGTQEWKKPWRPR
jgi:arabinofuranosyltransferase